MSQQHAENSGSYTFEKPVNNGIDLPCGIIDEFMKEPEPAPTVSLYNLLDQSEIDLAIAATVFTQEADRLKNSLTKVSETLYAWATLFKAAINEKKDRDSEAWAEKTAKEITKDTL